MAAPGDLKYTKSHEWARVDGDIVTIGMTDYAQGELGDITYLELPEPGEASAPDEPFGVVESVKAASDIYAPVDGEVVERNEDAVGGPEVVNASPYEQAWLVKIRVDDPARLDELDVPRSVRKVPRRSRALVAGRSGRSVHDIQSTYRTRTAPRCWRRSASPGRGAVRAIPEDIRPTGPAPAAGADRDGGGGPPDRAGRQEPADRAGQQLPRRRAATATTCRRVVNQILAARRVLHRLHAVPARGRAGHARR